MYLLCLGGTVGQVRNLFMDNYMTDVYVQRAKRDGLHRALISLSVAVEGR